MQIGRVGIDRAGEGETDELETDGTSAPQAGARAHARTGALLGTGAHAGARAGWAGRARSPARLSNLAPAVGKAHRERLGRV